MRLKPTPIDTRDRRFHFHKLFGSLGSPVYRDIDNDAHLTLPDQNALGRPEECTGITVTDIATDQDRILYSADFQFMKTLQDMGASTDLNGADARKAFLVAVSIGLLPKDKEPQNMHAMPEAWAANPANWPTSLLAETVKKPAVLPVSRETGQDWFDAIYNALDKGFSVGIATQWSSDFENALYILPFPNTLFWGHMYKISGCTILNGTPYLTVKSWQGSKYQEGFCLMTREVINALMKPWGTYAATLAHLPSDVVDAQKQQRIAILQTLLDLLLNLLHGAWYAGKAWLKL